MARVSQFTVFLVVAIVIYTILGAAVNAALTGASFHDPYGAKVDAWDLSPSYDFSEAKNVTGTGEGVRYEDLNPDRTVIWTNPFFIHYFSVYRFGTDFWDSWYSYEMAGSPILGSDIIEDWDSEKGYSHYTLDLGGAFQTDFYVYPQWNGSSEEWLYDNIEDSIDGNTVTIVLATNASYPSFDIGIILGVMTGFVDYGAPLPIAVILGGLWWAMAILVVVKLVVG